MHARLREHLEECYPHGFFGVSIVPIQEYSVDPRKEAAWTSEIPFPSVTLDRGVVVLVSCSGMYTNSGTTKHRANCYLFQPLTKSCLISTSLCTTIWIGEGADEGYSLKGSSFGVVTGREQPVFEAIQEAVLRATLTTPSRA